MVYFSSEKYSKEQQKSALAKIRDNKKEKKAWEEDNEKRKQEDKPSRTLSEYRADNSSSPPASSLAKSPPPAEPQPFDPREPQPNRLPNMKIRRATTEEQKNGIRRYREQLGHSRRAEPFSPYSQTTAAAGKKRSADYQDGSIFKKPKLGPAKAVANTQRTAGHQGSSISKKPDTGASASRTLKRRSDDHGSSPNKRTKTGSFLDFVPKSDSKAEAGSESKGGSKAQSTASKHAEGGQSSEAPESPKAKSATANTTPSANKECGTETSFKPVAGAEKAETENHGKAEEQGADVMKASVVNAATRTDKAATTGEPSKPASESQSPQASLATAQALDGAEQNEQAPDTAGANKPAEKPTSTTSSENTGPGTKDEAKSGDVPAGSSAAVASCAAVPDGDATANASSDMNKASSNTAADSTIPSPGNKRKRDDQTAGPAKKPKLTTGNPKNSLRNPRQACYINASMHALHSVPALASLRNENTDAISADNNLSEADTKSTGIGGKSRMKEQLRTELRNHLKLKADRNELKLSPHFNNMMAQLSADQDEPLEINPFVFHQVCGTFFTGNEDEPMNGDTQEDAHEFMTKLLRQIKDEQPELDIDELFTTQFAERQVCECGEPKMFVEETVNFNIPEFMQPKGKKSNHRAISLGNLFAEYARDQSKFADYRCEKCGESGRYSTKDGWEGKRMTQSPEYLIANVPRGQVQTRGNRVEEIKLMNEIRPPLRKVYFPSSVDGGRVYYSMVAMIRHQGTKGHYTTIRKIGDQWFHCDDTAKGGVTPLSRADVHDYTDGCVFLLKKTSAEDVDETT